MLEAALAEDPALNSAALALLVQEQFGLSLHPRSVERALQRRPVRAGAIGLTSLSVELVRLLTAMALSCQRRCCS